MPGGRNARTRQDAILRLRQLIADGRFAVGTPLPSERELARILGLPQPTVHRAVAALEADGTVSPADGHPRLIHPPIPGTLDRTVVVLGGGRQAKHTEAPGFSDHLQQAAHAAAAQQGWTGLAFDPRLLDEAALDRLIAGRPVGVLLSDLANRRLAVADLAARLAAARIPLVACDDSPAYASCDRCISDHAAGAGLLVDWLVARGRRRLLMAWERSVQSGWWYQPRVAGYRAALTTAGLPVFDPVHVAPLVDRLDVWAGDGPVRAWIEDHSRHWVGWLTEPLRRERIDGILVHTDGDAFAVRAALTVMGVADGDVDVVGYDDVARTSPFASLAAPPLATIDKLYPLQGERLIHLLADRVLGRLPKHPEVRLLPPRLVAPAVPDAPAQVSRPPPRQRGAAR